MPPWEDRLREKTGSWSDGSIAVALILLILSGVLLFSTRARQQTADSLDYALSARAGLGMYHPHHLLFIPILRLFLTALSNLGVSRDPILAGQIHNVLWAALTTLCFFIVARRLLGSTPAATLAAAFLLVTRGFWLYSTQLEVYVPATGCLALMTVLLVGGPRAPLRAKRLVLLSLLLALAVLYHQSNLFFCIPLGYLLLGEVDRKWRSLWVMASAGALVLTAYLLAFHYTDVETRIPEILSTAQKSSLEGFVRFCLAYRYHPSPGWGTWRNVSVMGVGRLIHSQIRDLITFPWILRFAVIPGFGLLMAGLALWNALQSARGATHATARRFLVIWLLTYDLFFLWWFPGEKEFFITLLYPLVLLAALAVQDWACAPAAGPRRRAWVLGGCVTLLGCVAATNARETILPYHRDRGPAYAAASILDARIPADCLVIGDYTVGQNLRYYFGRERFWETAMPLFYFYQDLPPARSLCTPRRDVCRGGSHLCLSRLFPGGAGCPPQARAMVEISRVASRDGARLASPRLIVQKIRRPG